MTITLYHCKSARSLRPMWVLEEMGLPYACVSLPFPPRIFRKDYLDVNPLGTVPCLIDGDVKMTESVAICQYLVERYGPTPLAVRSDESDYPDYLNWLHRSEATFTFPQTIVLRYGYHEPLERRNPQIASDYTKWLTHRLRSLETALANREYLCAGRFTIADICVGFALFLASAIPIPEAMTPNIARYWGALKVRPAFARIADRG